MIALITLLAMIGAYFIANALNRTTSDVQIERDRKTQQALQEAKAILLAHVATQGFKVASTLTDVTGGSLADAQIGYLPCPDTTDNTATSDDDGLSDTCNTADTRIGRLPWATIGASDLRDGSGERLWYAISSNYRKAAGTTTINVDTPGSLSLTGSITASDIVAVIIAPGAALSTQTRAVAAQYTVGNYLEGANAGTNDEIFFSAAPRARLTIGGVPTLVTPIESDCTTEPACLAFNDQVITITRAELWQAADAAVPALLQNLQTTGSLGNTTTCPATVGGYLEEYRCTWGRYPFPAQFTNPESSSYLGTVGETSGLLPIASDVASLVTWKNPTTSPATSSIQMVDTNATMGSITPSPVTCSRISGTEIRCSLTSWTNRPTIQINNLYLNGAGQALIGTIDASAITIIANNNSCNKTPTNFTVSQNLTPYQSGPAYAYGQVIPSFRLRSSTGCTGTVDVRIISTPPVLAMTSSTDAYLGWLKRNQWERHLQYAVAPGWLPSGSGSCVAGTCLTAQNYPSSGTNFALGRVLVVAAGRALPAYAGSTPAFTAQSRPSSGVADYFEGENTSSGDRIFTHNPASTRTANDRVILLSP